MNAQANSKGTPMESLKFAEVVYKQVPPPEPFTLLPDGFNSLGSILFIEKQ